MKYRLKDAIVDAIQFTGRNDKEIAEFIGESTAYCGLLTISTKMGVYVAAKGDYIIKSATGILSVRKPDVFQAEYEPISLI